MHQSTTSYANTSGNAKDMLPSATVCHGRFILCIDNIKNQGANCTRRQHPTQRAEQSSCCRNSLPPGHFRDTTGPPATYTASMQWDPPGAAYTHSWGCSRDHPLTQTNKLNPPLYCHSRCTPVYCNCANHNQSTQAAQQCPPSNPHPYQNMRMPQEPCCCYCCCCRPP